MCGEQHGPHRKSCVCCVCVVSLYRWCWPPWWTSPWGSLSSRRRLDVQAPLWSHDSSATLPPLTLSNRIPPPSRGWSCPWMLSWPQFLTLLETELDEKLKLNMQLYQKETQEHLNYLKMKVIHCQCLLLIYCFLEMLEKISLRGQIIYLDSKNG